MSIQPGRSIQAGVYTAAMKDASTWPPVYRPATATIAQSKASAATPVHAGGAPPVYRPQPLRIMQLKPAIAPQPRHGAPPVYRPAATPNAVRPSLQPMRAAASAAPPVYRPQANGTAQRTAAPPVYRPIAPAHSKQVVQRVRRVDGAGKTYHMKYGDFWMSEPGLPTAEGSMIIELLEYDIASARRKVQLLIASRQPTTVPMAIVIGLNQRVKGPMIKEKDKDTQKEKLGNIEELDTKANAAIGTLDPLCKQLAQSMEDEGIGGGAFPFAWRATNDSAAGYVFPFWEARSRLTLHAGAKAVQDALRERTGYSPVIRSMDGDVTKDPLFSAQQQVASKMTGLINGGKVNLVTGGYAWATTDLERALNATSLSTEVRQRTDVLDRLTAILGLLNSSENRVRMALTELAAKAVYWPEPNTYMSFDLRLAGAQELEKIAREKGTNTAQQGESTNYVKLDQVNHASAMFSTRLVTQKPLKDYFGDFLVYFATAVAKKLKPTTEDIKVRLKTVRQTHLNLENIESNIKWHLQTSGWDSLKPQLKLVVDAELGACAAAIAALYA